MLGDDSLEGWAERYSAGANDFSGPAAHNRIRFDQPHCGTGARNDDEGPSIGRGLGRGGGISSRPCEP